MTTRQFIGWFKKSYPEIEIRAIEYPNYQKAIIGKSSNIEKSFVVNPDILINEIDQELYFYGLATKPKIKLNISEESDAKVLMFCRILFGDPIYAFEYKSQNKKETLKQEQPSKQKEKVQEKSIPEPEKKPEISPKPKQQSIPSVIKQDRNNVMNLISSKLGDRVVFEKLMNGAIEVKVNGVGGLILYDYGISPNRKSTHIFIPYSKDSAEELINEYLNNNQTSN